MPSSTSMATPSLLCLLLSTFATTALAQSTTVSAYFAPPRVAASVITMNPTATTYTFECTSLCTGTQAAAGTLVNGPSTAGLTQIWTESDQTQKTLIYDCGVASKSVGNCVVHAVSDGTTGGSFTQTSTFKSGAILVTGGLEKLGYALATATTEVEAVVTVKKTSGIATVTQGVVSNSTSSSTSYAYASSITGTGSHSTSSASKTSLSQATTSQQTRVSVGAAAATVAAERLGAAVIGIAGLVLAAL